MFTFVEEIDHIWAENGNLMPEYGRIVTWSMKGNLIPNSFKL